MMNAINLFKNKNFCLLWGSQIVSQAGSRMFQIAMAWWILTHYIEHSGRHLGLFMLMGFIPAIFLLKWIGKTVDLIHPRKILLYCDAIGALAALVMGYLFGIEGLWFSALLGFNLTFSTLQSFLLPTLNKSIHDIVSPEESENAVAFISSTETIASLLGAVAGAFMIDQLGFKNIILINGASYLVSFICDGFLKFPYLKKRKKERPFVLKKSTSIATPWQVLRPLKKLRLILISFGAVNFFLTPFTLILPVYVKKTLLGSASTLGLLESFVFIGLLLGTFSTPFFHFKNRTLMLAALSLSIAGAALIIPGLTINIFIFALSLFSLTFFLGVMNIRLMQLFQTIVPPSIKGRFFALLQALIGMAIPLGYFVFGLMIDFYAPTTITMIQGMGVLILAGFFWKISIFADHELAGEELDHSKKEFSAYEI